MTFPVKPPRRSEEIKVYVNQDEANKIKKAAVQCGMSISEFSRVVILGSVSPTPHMDDIKKESS